MTRRNLNLITLFAILSIVCYHRAARNRYAGIFAEAMNLISTSYVEPIDERELFDAAMTGMVGKLDPYSDYFNQEQYEQFAIGIDQNLEGIGIEVTLDPDTKRLTIVSPLVGTPAYKAGIRAGDQILAVNGESTKGWRLQDAVGVLRGKPGTSVELTVLHKGDEKPEDLTVERAKIIIESVLGDTRQEDGTWNFFLNEHPRIGYVRLTTFGEQTVSELRGVVTSTDHPIDALILDLRGNPGGLLTSAIEVCDMFIDEGVIVSTRGRNGKVIDKYEATTSRTVVPADMPVVMLVNQGSASASEIVAACLQDHQRAVVVGERTWGKGTVQNLIDLEGGRSALKLTIATYWRPSGKNIHRLGDADEQQGDWGVAPDKNFEVKLTDEELEQWVKWRRAHDVVHNGDVDEETTAQLAKPRVDPQLSKAIEYIQQQLDGP